MNEGLASRMLATVCAMDSAPAGVPRGLEVADDGAEVWYGLLHGDAHDHLEERLPYADGTGVPFGLRKATPRMVLTSVAAVS